MCSVRNIYFGIAAVVLVARPVFAQPATTAWSVTSGIERFAFTDIVRGHPPVDASPIAWQGSGPMFTVARTRTAGPRVHRFEFVLADTGDFSYLSKQREFAADPEDGAFHLEGRYEYHRDVLTRHVPAWLRPSIAVRGSGAWLSITHHVPPANDISLSSTDACGAFVVAARIAAGQRISGDVNYANGLRLGRVSPHGFPGETHAAAGGWTTDLALVGTVRVATRYAVAVRYFDRGDGLESNHRSFTTSQRQISVGVVYAK